MIIPPFIVYITHLTSISILGRIWNPRAPVLRVYVGIILSTVGLCSLAGYYFPTTFTESLITMMQAYAIVDMLTYVEDRGYAILQQGAIFYICKTLEGLPELYYIPAIGLYAIAPAYYTLTACFPFCYNRLIYGLIHMSAGILAPIYYLVNNSQMIYVSGLHMVLLTNSLYEFGRWTSRLNAV